MPSGKCFTQFKDYHSQNEFKGHPGATQGQNIGKVHSVYPDFELLEIQKERNDDPV